MENLSPESKALYDLLRAETTEEYEARFLAYKKETLDAVHKFVATTTKEIKAVSTEIEAVRTVVSNDGSTLMKLNLDRGKCFAWCKVYHFSVSLLYYSGTVTN